MTNVIIEISAKMLGAAAVMEMILLLGSLLMVTSVVC